MTLVLTHISCGELQSVARSLRQQGLLTLKDLDKSQEVRDRNILGH